MNKGRVEVICGCGAGKTSLAVGKAISALTSHKKVIMIQLLKGSQNSGDLEILKRLEPEMKIFRFEKSEVCYDKLTGEEKNEELINIKNGLNFAKKVMTTGECDLLVLDEILGLLDHQMMTVEELRTFMESRDDIDLILTGNHYPEELKSCVCYISRIENLQVDNKMQ